MESGQAPPMIFIRQARVKHLLKNQGSISAVAFTADHVKHVEGWNNIRKHGSLDDFC